MEPLKRTHVRFGVDCREGFGFEVRPWFKNVENSIRKMPKWYMRDWANVQDEGKRAETLVAYHLLKAVEGWTDDKDCFEHDAPVVVPARTFLSQLF